MRSGVGCRDALGDDPSASMGSRGISCGFCSMSREQGAAGIAGGHPTPGGWNRFQLAVDNLDLTREHLMSDGVPLRGDVVEGPGGRQLLAEDPSGNPVEIFEPRTRRG